MSDINGQYIEDHVVDVIVYRRLYVVAKLGIRVRGL